METPKQSAAIMMLLTPPVFFQLCHVRRPPVLFPYFGAVDTSLLIKIQPKIVR